MISLLAGWLTNPLLLAVGVPLVALPIIIHLLNKRKFKIVDWAAMDFLLDADKRNRRRVRLENLILLLLRCLAVLLIAFLLARPFLPARFMAGLSDSAQFERIVLLDDSLSMQVRTGNQSALDEAKQSLIQLLEGLAAGRSVNTLTLVLASQPDQEPLLLRKPISQDTIVELSDKINAIKGVDEAANMSESLQKLVALVGTPADNNRVAYVITDMRRRDWQPDTKSAAAEVAPEDDPAQVLKRLAAEVTGCILVDVGAPKQNNLVLAEIVPEDTLVAGVACRFDVVVQNHGEQEVQNLTVKFTVGDSIPQTSQIESLPAGGSEKVPFSFTFARRDPAAEKTAETTESVRVRAEVISSNPAQEDRIAADSSAFFAARVVPGIPTLIVDGEPSAVARQAESYYLRRALVPPGDVLSGIVADVATEGELETLSLGKYKVIFLCNVFHLGEKTLSTIEAWTRAGGGLVIFPGDQTDENFFNKSLFAEGQGLSPLRLEGIKGDETERTWVTFKIEEANHPALKGFEGQNDPLLASSKTFRWWSASIHKDHKKEDVSVPLRFSDSDDSLAMAEQKYGDGRVVTFAMPADHAWSSWPDDPSYLLSMQELARYLVGKKLAGEGEVRVGERLRQPLDLTIYKTDAVLSHYRPDSGAASADTESPENENKWLSAPANKANVQAVDSSLEPDAGKPKHGKKATSAAQSAGDATKDDGKGADSGDQAIWYIDYPDTQYRGFYELTLTRNNDEGVAQILFAANVDPTEGDLKRFDANSFKKDLGDARVQIVGGKEAGSQGSQNELWMRDEIWKAPLFALVAVLAVEQGLGWLFGRKR